MSKQNPPFPLRIDPETRAKLEALAKANGRSLNAQLTLIVESALQSEPEIKGLMGETMREEVRQIARETALELIREELAKVGK